MARIAERLEHAVTGKMAEILGPDGKIDEQLFQIGGIQLLRFVNRSRANTAPSILESDPELKKAIERIAACNPKKPHSAAGYVAPWLALWEEMGLEPAVAEADRQALIDVCTGINALAADLGSSFINHHYVWVGLFFKARFFHGTNPGQASLLHALVAAHHYLNLTLYLFKFGTPGSTGWINLEYKTDVNKTYVIAAILGLNGTSQDLLAFQLNVNIAVQSEPKTYVDIDQYAFPFTLDQCGHVRTVPKVSLEKAPSKKSLNLKELISRVIQLAHKFFTDLGLPASELAWDDPLAAPQPNPKTHNILTLLASNLTGGGARLVEKGSALEWAPIAKLSRRLHQLVEEEDPQKRCDLFNKLCRNMLIESGDPSTFLFFEEVTTYIAEHFKQVLRSQLNNSLAVYDSSIKGFNAAVAANVFYPLAAQSAACIGPAERRWMFEFLDEWTYRFEALALDVMQMKSGVAYFPEIYALEYHFNPQDIARLLIRLHHKGIPLTSFNATALAKGLWCVNVIRDLADLEDYLYGALQLREMFFDLGREKCANAVNQGYALRYPLPQDKKPNTYLLHFKHGWAESGCGQALQLFNGEMLVATVGARMGQRREGDAKERVLEICHIQGGKARSEMDRARHSLNNDPLLWLALCWIQWAQGSKIIRWLRIPKGECIQYLNIKHKAHMPDGAYRRQTDAELHPRELAVEPQPQRRSASNADVYDQRAALLGMQPSSCGRFFELDLQDPEQCRPFEHIRSQLLIAPVDLIVLLEHHQKHSDWYSEQDI